MTIRIRSLEGKLVALLVGSFLVFVSILAVFHGPVADLLPFMAGLLVLGGSVSVIFVRRTKRRFRELIQAMMDEGEPSIRVREKRDEIDALSSALWQLIEKLRESEQKYRDVVDNSQGLIVAADVNRNITFVGKGLREALGYEPEDVIGTPLFRFCHPDDLERAHEAFRRVVAGEPLKNFEGRYAHKSGGWVDFVSNASPIYGTGKDVRGVLITAIEVTETKKLERRLQLLSAAVESSSDLIGIADLEGKILYLNPAGCRILGYETSEMSGRNIREVSAESEESIVAGFRRIRREGKWTGRYTLRRKDGSTFLCEFAITVIKDSQGVPFAVVNVARDITEHRKAEEALRDSEERYRHIFEQCPFGIGLGTPDGEVVSANKAMQAIMGYPIEEFRKVNLDDIYENAEDRKALLEAVRQYGSVVDFPTRMKRKDGTVFDALLSVSRISFGDKVFVHAMCQDVTERLKAEERLRQTQKIETVGILAGGIAHDFNNLLGGIVGYASILRSSTAGDSPEYRYASMIEKAAARASDLTSTLLSFARKGKGRPFPTDLNNLVREAISLLQAPLQKGGNVRSHFHPQRIVVEADPTQIHQAIFNVLINAHDAAGMGGNIEIETYVREADAAFRQLHPECRAGSYAVVSIKDDGPGMDEESRKRAFEPFFSTKTDRRRTGLGLAITYNIVRNREGCVDIQSEPGKGTIVRMHLPLSDKEVPPPAAGPELARGSETLLVIDDDETIRNVAREMLAKLGYRVLLASDGRTGIEIYRQRRGEIDLVIIDMMLADMGGDETFRQLKEMNPQLKAVVSSAYPFDGNASKIIREGAGMFIHKPYNLRELSSAIRDTLDRE